MQNENQSSMRSKDDLGAKARELGRDVKNQASDLAQSATDTVKDQASKMTEAARDMASQAGDKMQAAMADQKNAGADYVSNIADTVRRVSYEFDGQIPQAGFYIRKAATQIDSVSEALRTRDISELMGDVQNFARQQPAAFFGAAVLAGFAAVRFFKSAPEEATSSSPQRNYGSGNTAYGAGTTTYGAGSTGSTASDSMAPMGMQR
jgi:gas vesicle protein